VPGSVGDFFWSGAAGTYFWIDPQEKMYAVMMLQMPFIESRTLPAGDARNGVWSFDSLKCDAPGRSKILTLSQNREKSESGTPSVIFLFVFRNILSEAVTPEHLSI
jgi:CubicO group peptidase (beta-lactamase class C family)